MLMGELGHLCVARLPAGDDLLEALTIACLHHVSQAVDIENCRVGVRYIPFRYGVQYALQDGTAVSTRSGDVSAINRKSTHRESRVTETIDSEKLVLQQGRPPSPRHQSVGAWRQRRLRAAVPSLGAKHREQGKRGKHPPAKLTLNWQLSG